MKAQRKKIATAIICSVLILMLFGFLRDLVNPFLVEKIELQTYDHVKSGRVELTEGEKWQLIALYNCSRRAGKVTAEPCCDSYGFKMYFRDGSTVYVGEGVRSKMIRRPESSDGYYLQNPLLIGYINKLVEKYDLPID